ncbi:tetratricopeptide repeat protein [Arenimonas sp. MALMAid1274]|uniref:tetratricopeptide repeat protein n=1 Tax=Arenimonas sp. MALMAid1274 TaxID=3411630 RepID=UPI003BA275E4
MKYDDAEFAFLNFETDLDNEAAGTHAGMYLAWAASRGLLGHDAATLAPLLARQVTGSQFYFDQCDGKLMDEDFNDEGNAFTASYYERQFIADYEQVFGADLPDTGHPNDDLCSLPDTWENFDRLAPLLDQRLAEWKQGGARPGSSPTATATPAVAPVALALEPTPGETLDALRKRAQDGDHEAWFDLGVEYITGQKVPQDMAEAARCFERGAERGSQGCQFNLGVCYQHGDGRPKDLAQAARWFAQAADAGHAEATFHLGLAVRHGHGVPQDTTLSNALMLVARARGSANAAREGVMAGTMLESGLMAERIQKRGQLLEAMAMSRAAAARRPAAPAAPRTGTPSRAPVPATRAPTVAAGTPAGAPSGWHAGRYALGLGAGAFILLLLLAPVMPGRPLQVAALVLAVVGAWGVHRCCAELGASPLRTWVFTLLALVPVAGSFACIAVLLNLVRRARE